MSNNKLREELNEAKELLKDRPGIDAERAWHEAENHRSAKNEKLDIEELDAVSGGADRD